MNKTDLVEKPRLRKDVPLFRPGDNVKIHVRVVEGNRERVQVFQGIVLRRKGGGLRETFTVRKVSFGVGVERTFPVHSPSIAKIEVASRGDVRRAKLYYLRELRGKRARIKELRGRQAESLAAADAEMLAALEAEEEAARAEAEAREAAEASAEEAAPEAEETPGEGAEPEAEPAEQQAEGGAGEQKAEGDEVEDEASEPEETPEEQDEDKA